MGVEHGWQETLSRQPPQLQRALRDDRGEGRRRRSLLMLAAGGVLALLAVILAQTAPAARNGAGAPVATVSVVVAAADIGFGERLTPEKLKLADVPAQTLPAGHFVALEPLLNASGHTAMRPIAVNEVLTIRALAAGATRLSIAPLFGPTMRALSVPVDDVTGVSGLLTPGDRVDVVMTRQPEDAMPHAELIAQNIRVLAVGSDMNIARDTPGVVKSVTLELTPAQAQKLTLAVATGKIGLALRHFDDNDRIRLQSLQVSDLNDGTVTRLIGKPGGGKAAAAPGNAPPNAAPNTNPPTNSVIVMRGNDTAQVPVLP